MWLIPSIQIRRIVGILLLFTAGAFQFLYGQQPADDAMRLLLISQDIMTSRESELQARAQALGINGDADIDQLRRQLYDYYQIEEIPQGEQEVTVPFQLTLLSADRLYRSGTPLRYLLLEGAVQLLFNTDNSDQPEGLRADRVVIELSQSAVNALGSVEYQREDQQIFGEALSIDYRTGAVSGTQGETAVSRENSEGTSIDYIITSDALDITSDPLAIAVSSGVISTKSEQKYFSISSDKLHMVSGGDILATNATVSLGRIPILWVPFVFYPGKTFVFNPVIGYSSEKGAFFSSTWAVYGRYPIEVEEQSSLASLFASSQEDQLSPDGWVFSAGIPKKDTWAERTDSYLALLFDTYQYQGVFVGIDTVNRSEDNRFNITTFGGLALVGTPPASGVYTIPSFRYLNETTAHIKTKLLDVSLSLPLYSDPKVLRDYGNRLTRFSLQSLLGTIQFPTNYRSDITGFDWEMVGSLTIPTDLVSPVIEQLRINHMVSEVHWDARTASEGSGYEITALTAPEIRATVSGTLVSWSREKDAAPEQTPSRLEPGFSYDRWAVEPPFTASVKPKESVSSSISLRYSLTQYLIQERSIEALALSNPSLYTRTAGSIDVSATIAPRYLTLSQKFLPIISYHETEAEIKELVSFSSTTDISIPLIGLSYGLSARLYDRSVISGTETGGWEHWDRDTVTRHQISWNQVFPSGDTRITPSLTLQLPPLAYSLTPKVVLAHGHASASASMSFSEQDTGGFAAEDIQLLFSYQDPSWLKWTSLFTYDLATASQGGHWIDALTWKQDATLQVCNSYLTIASKSLYTWSNREFNILSLSTSLPYFSIYLQTRGPFDQLDVEFIDAKVTLDAWTHTWWKNRISLAVDLTSSYRHALSFSYTSLFTFGVDIKFFIAEFITLDISLNSINTGVNRYQSVQQVWEDLWRSFDLFGDGRHHTFFTMESLNISLIHHMADWDLHCKYEGSVVLSDLEWEWRPTFSVFLQWKAIPEITVDRSFDMRDW